MQKLISLSLSILCLTFINSSFAAAPAMPPVAVTTAKAKLEEQQLQIKATGTLSATQGIMVRPEIAGRVTKILFSSGDYVKAGTPLVQLYPDILQAQMKSDKAKLLKLQRDYDRVKTLYAQGNSSRSSLDAAISDLRSVEADVDKDRAELKQTLIRAPFAGQLGLRKISLGDFVAAGQDLVALEALEPIRVDFSIPEVYLGQLAKGQKVNIKASAFPNKLYQGTVYAYDAQINANTRSLGVRASIPNHQHKLLPGMFVEVTLYAGPKQKLVTVPQTAIVYSEGQNYVYRVDGKQVKQIKVTLGEHFSDRIAVTKGLSAGQEVVSAGTIKLHNGATIIKR